MSEKYYVVSESELVDLEIATVEAYVNSHAFAIRDLGFAYSASRARPVLKLSPGDGSEEYLWAEIKT